MVGINKYEKPIKCLKNAVGDADAVGDELDRVGVKAVTRVSDCDYKQLTTAINKFLGTVRKGGVAIVYLAAHAAMYRNQHVFMTTTSTKENISHTSLSVDLLKARSIPRYIKLHS